MILLATTSPAISQNNTVGVATDTKGLASSTQSISTELSEELESVAEMFVSLEPATLARLANQVDHCVDSTTTVGSDGTMRTDVWSVVDYFYDELSVTTALEKHTGVWYVGLDIPITDSTNPDCVISYYWSNTGMGAPFWHEEGMPVNQTPAQMESHKREALRRVNWQLDCALQGNIKKK